MTINDILKLRPGDRIAREGEQQVVRSVSVVPLFRDEIDLSYLEMLYTGPRGDAALYASPVRLGLDLREFERGTIF